MTDLIKIVILLEKDEDGYPPVETESVWARSAGEGRAVLDNIPFFATVATLGDTVEYADVDGELQFVRVLEHSGNSLIRVYYRDDANAGPITTALVGLGCEVERDQIHHLLAVSVSASVSLTGVQAYLGATAEELDLEFEEPILMQ